VVNYQHQTLDRIFTALADPTRRTILAQLRQRSLSVSQLARPFHISLPAVMKHLDVLSDAKLIKRRKTGRTVACVLAAAPMEQATKWLNTYKRFWDESLDRLDDYLFEAQSNGKKEKKHGNKVK
jgi:DNA-binding transcriptional ArsR family regulator